jgi:hypothetical protein
MISRACGFLFTFLLSFKCLAQFPMVIPRDSVLIKKPSLPLNFYHSNTGFFCKTELKLQKLTKVPIFFRLGSTDYCNKLEGK